jgi:hypothetical protein
MKTPYKRMAEIISTGLSETATIILTELLKKIVMQS